MFTGHFAVALLARRGFRPESERDPKLSLGAATFAATLVDLICFALLIVGVERFAPVPGVKFNRMIGENIAYSHSLLGGIVLGAIFAAIYFLKNRYWRGAAILLALVVSHWGLDVISHRPDMPLAPGVPLKLGFGLWDSMPATILVEGGLWLVAVIFYVRTARLSTGRLIAFWTGVAILTMIGVNNPRAGMDPDPVKAGVAGLIVFGSAIGWAYWIDRAPEKVTSSRELPAV